MKSPITYIPNFISKPNLMFEKLKADLNWVRRDSTPRSEYYINDFNVPYTYGRGRGEREYQPQVSHELIESIRQQLFELTQCRFEVCFLNKYSDQSDHLGWHSDDSPEMDDNRPIAIISLGAHMDDKKAEERLKLENGSLCLMHAGMQDTHLHRIPKAGFVCGERISLTFRGYVKDDK
jgi:alkylated DNA repair dioxygenase AlkB